MRARSKELEFSNFLLKIGDGDYPSVRDVQQNGSSVIDLPSEIIAKEDIAIEIFSKVLHHQMTLLIFLSLQSLLPKMSIVMQ